MKSIVIDVYIQDFIDNLVIDPNKMNSVLINVIDNGIDYTKEIKYIDKDVQLNKYNHYYDSNIKISPPNR